MSQGHSGHGHLYLSCVNIFILCIVNKTVCVCVCVCVCVSYLHQKTACHCFPGCFSSICYECGCLCYTVRSFLFCFNACNWYSTIVCFFGCYFLVSTIQTPTSCTFHFASFLQDGWTAVLLAARYGHKEVVQELCETFGADFLHRKKVKVMQTI